jgi:triphosphatase
MSRQTKHPSIKLSKNMTLENAFEVMAFHCISQLESSTFILTTSYDIEALHQMRVGLRRIDAFLGFYNDILEIPVALKSELKWLGRHLSLARDCDVLIHSTLPMINNKKQNEKKYSNPKLIEYLVDKLEIEEKHKQIIAIIGSQRYIKFLKKLKTCLLMHDKQKTFPTKQQFTMSQEIKKVASVKLKEQFKALINLYQNINIKRRKNIHRIRIATKKMRYSIELLQSLYSKNKVSAYIKNLVKLQDSLGLFNDIKLAHKLLKELDKTDTVFHKEKKLIRLSLKNNLRVKRQEIESACHGFMLTTPFWKH